ncbi:uncharacterized protein LOC106532549 [Austrofundulus limnaeus]|uniref:Uncharacterized protein LOC106532549 n=1 Tax=Austrofundulus limnaeus TaxID=52670 RepID=A0A2I4CVT6_AUSLI|nr:PREDICTED: uncharacterized protein LOC106532549 [Austrofundulus limnaeus]
MESDQSLQLRYRFFGYLAAYIHCLYGHRPGVLVNLTVSEVKAARRDAGPDAEGFVINVEEHKTTKTFGMAQTYLTKEEFAWLERWVELRTRLNPPNDYFIWTMSQTAVKTMGKNLKTVWEEMQLPGSPTFTDIRTAVTTYARNTQNKEVRAQMARLMCHDISTAEKFYAIHLNASQAKVLRDRFEESTSPEFHASVAPLPQLPQAPSPKKIAPQKSAPPTTKSATESESSEESFLVPYDEGGLSSEEITPPESESRPQSSSSDSDEPQGTLGEAEQQPQGMQGEETGPTLATKEHNHPTKEQGETQPGEEAWSSFATEVIKTPPKEQGETRPGEEAGPSFEEELMETPSKRDRYRKLMVKLSPFTKQMQDARVISSRARRALLRATKKEMEKEQEKKKMEEEEQEKKKEGEKEGE